MGTFYDTLQLSCTATPDQIKASYRALLLRYHPDKQDSAAARGAGIDAPAAAMRRPAARAPAVSDVQHAYDTLRDPQRRAEYDASIRAAQDLQHVHPWDSVALTDLHHECEGVDGVFTFECRCGDRHLCRVGDRGHRGTCRHGCGRQGAGSAINIQSKLLSHQGQPGLLCSQ